MGSLDHDSQMAKRKLRLAADLDDSAPAAAPAKRAAAFNPSFATSEALQTQQQQQQAAAQSAASQQQLTPRMEVAGGIGVEPPLDATQPLQMTQALVTYRPPPPGTASHLSGTLAAMSGPEGR
jgi:hypothetical protein